MKNNRSIPDKQKKLNIKVENPQRILIRQWSFCMIVFAFLFLSACAISKPSSDVPKKGIKYDASTPILNDLIVNNEFDSSYLNRMKRDTNFIYHFYPVTFKKENNKGKYLASHQFYVKNVQTENPADSLFIYFIESNLYNKSGAKKISCSFRYYYFPSNLRLAKQKFKELDRYFTKRTKKRIVGPTLIFEGKPKEHEKEISFYFDNDKGWRNFHLTLDFESNLWLVEIN